MAICGLFFGLVISPKSQNQNLPTGSIPKTPGKHHFVPQSFGNIPPKKNTRIFETMGKNPPVPPYMAQKHMQLLYLCFEVPGEFLVDNKRAQISNRKKNPPSTVNLHGFSPGEPPPAWAR